MAVVVLFFKELSASFSIWIKLLAGFIPTAFLGFFFYKIIKSLFDFKIVSIMLILGGIVFLLIEFFYKEKEHHVKDIGDISLKQAFLIGLFQSLAMIPGTSRSGATIIGGLLLGLKRETAAKFSFLLAVPTMFAASGYDIYKNYSLFDIHEINTLLTGFVVSFVVALIVIKWFLSFLKRHSFIIFGFYRILAGTLFILIFN